ncbi:hypothetical protein SDRG_12670 [Saprolegnia diclina VS20]|uniref:MYND-type domain-containing protein n=1 Tax=Saprolegnia diclina (strain VS20) TaxID=1156394 RepID=T0Q4X5_SAPDV|nr:hypothetical protein SDRG_12670 [Saprolegnia diclina VS20]EQC29666.1 hypothetical protein SDRG_12670 [Saprolegnia diclina VS20]|eukprot:XP_008616970.1 hypothetical protein SDRG_12670 [Saprolegnia diclina VS20]
MGREPATMVASPTASELNNESAAEWATCSNCSEQTVVRPCPARCGRAAYCSSLCLVHHKTLHRSFCRPTIAPTVVTKDADDVLVETDNNVETNEVEDEDDMPLLDMLQVAEKPPAFLKKTFSSLFLLPSKLKKLLPSDEAIAPESFSEDAPAIPFTYHHVCSPRANLSEPWSRFSADFNMLKFYVHQSGPAGLQLEVGTDGGLIVIGISRPLVWAMGIRPGDQLDRIGGMSTSGLAPDEAFRCLYRADLPTVLRFKATARVQRETWTILLQDRLGVTFAGDGRLDIPVVDRVVARTDESPQVGDLLVLVNDVYDAVAHGLSATLRYIHESPRPVALTFQRLLSDAAPMPRPPSEPALLTERELSDVATEIQPSSTRTLCATTLSSASGNVVLVWRDGFLGVTLLEDPALGLPAVHRLTGKGQTPLVGQLGSGYTLVSVNGDALLPHCMVANCARLASAPKPVLLLFAPPRKQRLLRAASLLDGPSARLNRSFARALCTPRASEYEVLWSSPPLGLVLYYPKHSPAKTPCVKRVKPHCALTLPASADGHQLVAVNNIATSGLASTDLTRLLHSAGFPIVLRFRSGDNESSSPPSNRISDSDAASSILELDATHRIVWRDGDLGLTFAPSAAGPVVKRVGSCSQRVRVGDILLHINSKPVPMDEPFSDTMARLVAMPKPIVLGFTQAPPDERGSSESL